MLVVEVFEDVRPLRIGLIHWLDFSLTAFSLEGKRWGSLSLGSMESLAVPLRGTVTGCCIIMRSCNPTKCTYQEQLKAKSIQNCEENTKKTIFNGWEASVNIVQKNGVIGQNIDIPLESREFGQLTKDTCISANVIN